VTNAEEWVVLLAAGPDGVSPEMQVRDGLHLLWATVRTVATASLDAEDAWRALQDSLSEVAAALSGTGCGPRLGAGDRPATALEDTPALRGAVGARLRGVHTGLCRIAQADPRAGGDVAHAAVLIEQAGQRWTTHR
jgi:hypothetical protein